MNAHPLHATLWMLTTAACAPAETGPWRGDQALLDLEVRKILPATLVPGSHLQLQGQGFVTDDWGTSQVRWRGTTGANAVDFRTPATALLDNTLDVRVTDDVFDAFGTGTFSGTAVVEVRSAVDERLYLSPEISIELTLQETLTPSLSLQLTEGIVFPNDALTLEGSGLLLEGEGHTQATVTGCFIATQTESCEPVQNHVVDLVPVDAFDRTRATLTFGPAIAGITPGAFRGEVRLRNAHKRGDFVEQAAQMVHYDLEAPLVFSLGTTAVSLGQYLTVEGAGFLLDQEGATLLEIAGTYRPDGNEDNPKTGIPVRELLIPTVVSGRLARYVLNEDDALAERIDIRYGAGHFSGTLTPITSFGDSEQEGEPANITFAHKPVKQVVFVQFLPDFTESLRHFGLRALDAVIRARVLEIVARDYRGVNIEVRDAAPHDFALFAQVDVAGRDPNELGLLGYDNTPGKDTDNRRLYDRIGGVNAKTQNDGYPGYGGVFIESLFGYSAHPGELGRSVVPTELFDNIFDPLRPDLGGQPVSAIDLPIAPFSPAPTCPANSRGGQIHCAAYALANVVGSTLAHEIGHSLGLADPYGPSFHNLGDAPDRLMDADRPFFERAQIGGGPSRFCTDEYVYLKRILPGATPSPEADALHRPGCY